MKILPINYDYNSNKNTNFKSIKNIKSTGYYSVHPEWIKKIKDALKQNPTADAFFKKYDVDIVLDMNREKLYPWLDVNVYGDFISTMKIFYENPAVGKVKNFLKRLNNSRDYITLSEKGNFDFCTDDLVEQILPKNPNKYYDKRGILSRKMRKIDKTLEGLDEKFFEEQKLKDIEKRKSLTDEEKALIIKRMPMISKNFSEYDYIKQSIREEEENNYHKFPESGAGLGVHGFEKYRKYVGSYFHPGTFTIDDYCYENRHLLNQ